MRLIEKIVEKLKKNKFLIDDLSQGPVKYMGVCRLVRYIMHIIYIISLLMYFNEKRTMIIQRGGSILNYFLWSHFFPDWSILRAQASSIVNYA